jgi:predicted pyridoxine 5'-phosphate oxidase superfamily flavin-nucleotide-binding protein
VSVILTQDMRAIIRSAHLCFAATVTPDGRPNVSPKGTIRVWDDGHLFFLDIASPGTRENLRANPFMELNVVDQLSRRGYRFSGRATIHESGELYDKAVSIVLGEENAPYRIASVVLLEVERSAPLISPGYWHMSDEHAMRASWRERRKALDTEFEAHLATQGAFRVEG